MNEGAGSMIWLVESGKFREGSHLPIYNNKQTSRSMEKKATIKSYKGFDRDLKCRGYQYEVGKEYTMDGDISCCNRGFHACESPLDVLDYYFLDESGQMARFCEVEQSGKIDKESGNTKVCSSKIKIKAELSFGSLVKAGVEWLKEITSSSDMSDGKQNDNGGNSARIGSSGDSAQIVSTGEDSVICCAGLNATVSAKQGSWITLSEWEYNDDKQRWIPKCVKTEYVDGERIKADTPYKLVNGEFTEV